MEYESFILNGLKVKAKVNVFVLVANADADARAMTLAPRTFVPARQKAVRYRQLPKFDMHDQKCFQ